MRLLSIQSKLENISFVLLGITLVPILLYSLVLDATVKFILLVVLFLLFGVHSMIIWNIWKVSKKIKLYNQCIDRFGELIHVLQLLPSMTLEAKELIWRPLWNKMEYGCDTVRDYLALYQKLTQTVKDYERIWHEYSKNDTKDKQESYHSFFSGLEKEKWLYLLHLPANTDDFSVVKEQYRQLMKQYHPDINPSNNQKAQEINKAYDELKKMMAL